MPLRIPVIAPPIEIPSSFAVAQHMVDIASLPNSAMTDLLAPASPKRQREHAAGRFCAARALQEYQEFGVVGVLPDRSPGWPPGFVGSISHSERLAWAAVARESELVSIGVDAERIVDVESMDEVAKLVLHADEQALLDSSQLEKRHAFTLAFSAKEASYKCVYPLGLQPLDFLDLSIRSIDNNTVTVGLSGILSGSASYQQLPGELPPDELLVHFAFREDHVFTFCCHPSTV